MQIRILPFILYMVLNAWSQDLPLDTAQQQNADTTKSGNVVRDTTVFPSDSTPMTSPEPLVEKVDSTPSVQNQIASEQSSNSVIEATSSSIPSKPKRRIINVAVLDITGSSQDFKADDLIAIASRFETELTKTGKVLVLERRNMDLILQEQGFQQSGACNSSECQVQMGELLGVDRIINGSISKVDKLYTLNLKMIDVESGKNILSHAIDIRGSMEDVLRGGCYELAQIFSGLKQPTNDHTVLTAEKRSLWPWIVGGVGIAAIGGGVILFLNSNKNTSNEKSRTIDNWSDQ